MKAVMWSIKRFCRWEKLPSLRLTHAVNSDLRVLPPECTPLLHLPRKNMDSTCFASPGDSFSLLQMLNNGVVPVHLLVI